MIFVGDDWAEDHHDVYLMDEAGARLASRRLPEGLAGIRGLHELVAGHAEEPGQVVIGIETDRGLWVEALGAAGYQVLCGQPVGGRPLPRPPPRFGGEIRCRGRQTAGRSGAHRPAQPPPDRRRQRRRRGDQGAGPGASEPDLGAHPAHQHPALARCASTTRPRWRRSTTWPTAMPWRSWAALPPPPQGAHLSLIEDPVGAQTRWAATQHRHPRLQIQDGAAHRATRRPRRGHRRVRRDHPRRGRHHHRAEPPDQRPRGQLAAPF